MAVQVQEIWKQSDWVPARQQVQKSDRGSRVWGEIARSDRGYEGNSRTQVAGFLANSGARTVGMKTIVTRRSQVSD